MDESQMMTAPRRISAMVFFAMVAFGGSAAAQETSLHARGSVSIAYTDNMMGAPSDPAPGEPGPIDVWFLELAPGLTLFSDQQTSRHIITYTHPYTMFLGESEANAHADAAEWRAMFTLSPRDELMTGISAYMSTTRLDALRNSSDTMTVDPTLLGDNTILRVDAVENYTRDLSRDWRVLQNAGAGLVYPIDTVGPQPTRYLGRLGFGIEHTAGDNAYALLGEGTYYVLSPIEEDGVEIEPSEEQIISTAAFRYRRDLSRTLMAEVIAGVTGAMRPGELGDGIWAFTPSAALRYNEDLYEAELSVSRSVSPSLITGQTYLSDAVRLRGVVPIHREAQILMRSSVGYAQNRVLDLENDELQSRFNSWVADATIGWYPDDLPSVFLRYSHYQQSGNEDDNLVAPDYHRNLVMLSVAGIWPSREMGLVATEPPQRVDEGDRDPTAPSDREINTNAAYPAANE